MVVTEEEYPTEQMEGVLVKDVNGVKYKYCGSSSESASSGLGSDPADNPSPQRPVITPPKKVDESRMSITSDVATEEDPTTATPTSSPDRAGATVAADDKDKEPGADLSAWTRAKLAIKDGEEDPMLGYDPMTADYVCDTGLTEDDPKVESSGIRFKEGRTKDVPCRFHDGFSGTCWKGTMCPYGHERYTGGKFAKKYPTLAFAASSSRCVTSILRLPTKPVLHNEREILCRVTHVVSPSEFYIRPTTEGGTCPCSAVEAGIHRMSKGAEGEEEEEDKGDPMDPYYYGFAGLEGLPEGLGGTDAPEIFVAPTVEEKLQSYLNTALRYKKLQVETYLDKVELVAVRVQNAWKRAVVMWSQERSAVRAQLLDTGEKVLVGFKDVSRLPEQFCNSQAAVFHCSLFRVSPVWFIWAKGAIQLFKELVENKEIRVIVKDGADDQDGPVYTFEHVPYTVKIMVLVNEETGEWADVSQKMIDSGYALEWNMVPYRPFANDVINTAPLEIVYQPVPEELPEGALELEKNRCIWKWELARRRRREKYGDSVIGSDDDGADQGSTFDPEEWRIFNSMRYGWIRDWTEESVDKPQVIPFEPRSLEEGKPSEEKEEENSSVVTSELV